MIEPDGKALEVLKFILAEYPDGFEWDWMVEPCDDTMCSPMRDVRGVFRIDFGLWEKAVRRVMSPDSGEVYDGT